MTRRLQAICGAFAAALMLVSAADAQERQWPNMGRGIPPSQPLNTLQDLYGAFFACWKAPPREDSRPGMEITIQFSVTRDGNVLGEPRFTFVSRDVPPATRAIYQRSIAEAFKTCSPFPLTESSRGSIAGRPQRLRFIDLRGQGKA